MAFKLNNTQAPEKVAKPVANTNATPTNLEALNVDRKRKIAERYKNEPKKAVQISPLYAPYFGANLSITLNGILVVVPVDGQTREIPRSFADEVASRIMAVDTTIKKASKLSDVANNKESYAGELKF